MLTAVGVAAMVALVSVRCWSSAAVVPTEGVTQVAVVWVLGSGEVGGDGDRDMICCWLLLLLFRLVAYL